MSGLPRGTGKLTDLLAPYQWKRLAFTLIGLALLICGALIDRGCLLVQEGLREMQLERQAESGTIKG